jgi:TetR/AcrR family transcriptional regulator, transcriptional repressor for nem operon
MTARADRAVASKRDEILEVAEAMIRTAGYNAFSTCDVADAVGIKAASVHYYFPTKTDIGVAVTKRYTARFVEELGEPGRFHGRANDAVAHYADAFRRALIRDGKLCLCAVLGAEIGGLPEDIGRHTRIFFEENLAWLAAAMRSPHVSKVKAQSAALLVLAGLEGAMILCKSLADDAVFDRVVDGLERTIRN